MDDNRPQGSGGFLQERNLKKFLKDFAIGALLVGCFMVGAIFGTSMLNNAHNLYIRILSSTIVKLTNHEGNSGATGFVVRGASGKKYILTNQHVCELANGGSLLANYQGEQFPVQVAKSYVWNDLCAMEAHRPLGMALHVARSVSIGETLYAVGHPLLEPTSVTSGEISGAMFISIPVKTNPKEGECSGPTYQVLDTSGSMYAFFGVTSVCVRNLEVNTGTVVILPGNSGSPILNIYGSVVGVMFAANEAGTRSYSVPLSDLKDFLGEL